MFTTTITNIALNPLDPNSVIISVAFDDGNGNTFNKDYLFDVTIDQDSINNTIQADVDAYNNASDAVSALQGQTDALNQTLSDTATAYANKLQGTIEQKNQVGS